MCLAAGCTAFLTKPIRQETLLQAIREHTDYLRGTDPCIGRADTAFCWLQSFLL